MEDIVRFCVAFSATTKKKNKKSFKIGKSLTFTNVWGTRVQQTSFDETWRAAQAESILLLVD
jgi:hypothetical protein